MNIEIEDKRLQLIWYNTWSRLSKQVQTDLDKQVSRVLDRPLYPGERYVYGTYSDGDHAITLFTEDLSGLSEEAKIWVMAHELGHAYCHQIFGNSSPCPYHIDEWADHTALAWGFYKEFCVFTDEKKVDQ